MEGKDYRKAAEDIIRIVGKDNIVSATHCATRLRLIVKDKEAIDVKKLEKLPLVKGTFFNAGQFQIILGTGIVNKVYEEIENLGLKTLSKKEQDEAIKNQQKGVKRLVIGVALMRLRCGEQSDDKPLAKVIRPARHLVITFTCYHIPGRICTD